MFIFDLTNPLTLLLVVLATALLIFLGQEIKRSSVAIIPLISFLVNRGISRKTYRTVFLFIAVRGAPSSVPQRFILVMSGCSRFKKITPFDLSLSKGVSFCKSLSGKSERAQEKYLAGYIVAYRKGEGL